VKTVAVAAPPAPEEARVAQADPDDAATFDVVMPGLIVLLDDEIQQMRATAQDLSVPVASRDVLTNALAADQQIEQRVNSLWPPDVEN
jgi:hypothetical protein